mgnify:CR=1 FL=1
MKSGYEGVLATDSISPWIAVISFSKALGTAQPGLSAMIVHDGLRTEMTARLARNNGLSYAPAFFENAYNIFQERNDKGAIHGRKIAWKGYPKTGGAAVDEAAAKLRTEIDSLPAELDERSALPLPPPATELLNAPQYETGKRLADAAAAYINDKLGGKANVVRTPRSGI